MDVSLCDDELAESVSVSSPDELLVDPSSSLELFVEDDSSVTVDDSVGLMDESPGLVGLSDRHDSSRRGRRNRIAFFIDALVFPSAVCRLFFAFLHGLFFLRIDLNHFSIESKFVNHGDEFVLREQASLPVLRDHNIFGHLESQHFSSGITPKVVCVERCPNDVVSGDKASTKPSSFVGE